MSPSPPTAPASSPPTGIGSWSRRAPGSGSAITDEEFARAGATLVSEAEAWSAELVLKVKEPQPGEYGHLRAGLVLFTFLHLAAYPDLAGVLLEAKTTAIGYETVRSASGALPLLAPMSEVAGRLAPQIGAHFLERANGGRGVLLGGAPGVRPARVVVIGAGTVGTNAAWIAQGMEAEVILIDRDLDRLRVVDQIHRGRIMTLASSRAVIERSLRDADLVIGAVLVPGGRAPVVVTDDMVRGMAPGTVIVDVAVDQGGCIETSEETTHEHPVVERHGVLHYGVGNIPAAVPHTSTYALTNATFPYALAVADHGVRRRPRRPTPPSWPACCARRVSSPTRPWPLPSGPTPCPPSTWCEGGVSPTGSGPARRPRKVFTPSVATPAWCSDATRAPSDVTTVTAPRCRPGTPPAPRWRGRRRWARPGRNAPRCRGWRRPPHLPAVGRPSKTTVTTTFAPTKGASSSTSRRRAPGRSRHQPSGLEPIRFMPSTTQCTRIPPSPVGARRRRTTIRV